MRRAIAPGGRPPRRTVRPRITPNQVYNPYFPIFPPMNSDAPKVVRGTSQNLEGPPIFAPNPEGWQAPLGRSWEAGNRLNAVHSPPLPKPTTRVDHLVGESQKFFDFGEGPPAGYLRLALTDWVVTF